jgi:hypothetical protein
MRTIFSLHKFLALGIVFIIISCGPSKEELALRERIYKDSIQKIMDSMANANQKRTHYRGGVGGGNRESGNPEYTILKEIDFSFVNDNNLLNKNTDLDCKLI